MKEVLQHREEVMKKELKKMINARRTGSFQSSKLINISNS